MLGALVCFPQGWLWQGVVVITLFVFADMLDGLMAKISGRPATGARSWTPASDRLGDAAVFGGILLYFAAPADSTALGRRSPWPRWPSVS